MTSTQSAELPSHWQSGSGLLPQTGPLLGTATTDVVIIGGGITGLTAALRLRQQGHAVTVLEGQNFGDGASGRGTGIIAPALRYWPAVTLANQPQLRSRFIERLANSAARAVEFLRSESLVADKINTGVLSVASNATRATLERNAAVWQQHGARFQVLDSAQIAARTGATAWPYAVHWTDGGQLNPRALIKAMMERASQQGVVLHATTPVMSYSRAGSRWVITAPLGRMDCRALIVTSGASSHVFSKRLAPEVIAASTPYLAWHLSTAPPNAKDVVPSLPRDTLPVVVSDGRLSQFRTDTAGNLILTGRFQIGTSANTARDALIADAAGIFGKARAAAIKANTKCLWSTHAALTETRTPCFYSLGTDGFAAIGGDAGDIALAIMTGEEFADAAASAQRNILTLPLTQPREPRRRTVRERLIKTPPSLY